ncbi:MAG TPA: hypothetical protein VMM35_04490 [Longimicrobiales bacterium]|nr:hypothetical protein [Longimicrobiales bacterium]
MATVLVIDDDEVISALRVLHAEVPIIAVLRRRRARQGRAAPPGGVTRRLGGDHEEPFEFRQLVGAVSRAVGR